MISAGVRAFHPTPEEDPERERIRDLSRPFPSPGATPSDEDTPVGCELAKDITLNALAQLGVFRFNANRSFVSIIDGDIQCPDDGHDGLSIATRQELSQTRRWYLSWSTVAGPDLGHLTLEDSFMDRLYVREWPHMRFYAEVPLFSASGYVLGSYCIIDDKPWTYFGGDQVNDLQEVADAIGLHLENSSVHAANHLPHESAATTADADDSVTTPDLDVPLGHAVQCVSPESPPSSSSTVAGGESVFFLQDQHCMTESSSLNSGYSDRPVVLSPGEGKSMGEVLKSGDTGAPRGIDQGFSKLSLTEIMPIYERIASIYSRASALLRDSMDLDGSCISRCLSN
ncbi:CheY-like superfamily [Penicillium mononematosum]|uniref:CheY-like superfamily n=1 Tax=Penicillium mononematosum TaxID=268346 RepID=UPI0025465A71|nr:CheY-like superfamily [Penicillium mononematosum]KAJ6190225.1 CheY-like superfamily [Penicillium mononematosum]